MRSSNIIFTSSISSLLVASLIASPCAAATRTRPPVIDMAVVDESGRPLRTETLSRGDRANLEKLRNAVREVAGSNAQGRIRITLECSEPPNRQCKLVITWGRDNA